MADAKVSEAAIMRDIVQIAEIRSGGGKTHGITRADAVGVLRDLGLSRSGAHQRLAAMLKRGDLATWTEDGEVIVGPVERAPGRATIGKAREHGRPRAHQLKDLAPHLRREAPSAEEASGFNELHRGLKHAGIKIGVGGLARVLAEAVAAGVLLRDAGGKYFCNPTKENVDTIKKP